MQVEYRLEKLIEFGKTLREKRDEIPFDIVKQKNPWFEKVFVEHALDAVLDQYLNEEALRSFAEKYEFSDKAPKTVGLILAGNIPLVGFHDILMTYLSGHRLVVKPSSKDDFLTPLVWQLFESIDPGAKEQIKWVEKLEKPDAVIATGSNNSFRYFDHYFKDIPNLLRKNRSSVAVLSGEESDEELKKLNSDIFEYFGLGCRNVSMLFIPEDFDLKRIFENSHDYEWLADNRPFRNNHDYRLAMYVMNRDEHLANDYMTLRASDQMQSPLGVVHYQRYKNASDVDFYTSTNQEDIQALVSKESIPFGEAQQPRIDSFADNIDTMKFLLGLY